MRIPGRLIIALVFGILSASFPTGQESAEAEENKYDIDWKTGGKLERLAQYIGTYNYEDVLDDPYVHQQLKEMLGNKLPHLRQNLQTRGPIDFEGSELILSGQKPHEGDVERGKIIIDLYNGQIHAGIYSQGHTTIYSKEKVYTLLPESLKRFIHWDEYYKLKETFPESNFEWVE